MVLKNLELIKCSLGINLELINVSASVRRNNDYIERPTSEEIRVMLRSEEKSTDKQPEMLICSTKLNNELNGTI